MNKEEFENWRSQFGTSNSFDKMGLRYAPYVFTEEAKQQELDYQNREKIGFKTKK